MYINSSIYNRVKKYPYFTDHIECYKLFYKLDSLIYDMYNLVSSHSNIINEEILFILSEVSSYSKNNRSVHFFDGLQSNSIIKESDLNFIEEGLNFIKCIEYDKFYDVRKLKLSRGLIKDIFSDFNNTLNTFTVLDNLRENSQVDNYLKEIENNLSMDRFSIPGVNNQLTLLLIEFKKIVDIIYTSFLRVVAKEARNIVKSREDAFPDAFQNGTDGVLRAINYFDITKNKSFKTYLTFWVRKAILESAEKETNIVPVSNSIWRKYRKFEKTGFCMPQLYEASKALKMKEDKLEDVILTIENRKVERLDAPFTSEKGGTKTLYDTIKQTTFDEESQILKEELFDAKSKIYMNLIFGIPLENNLDENEIKCERVKQLNIKKEAYNAKISG